MDRYKNSRIKRKDKKSYYKTIIYQKIPKSESDIYVITQFGDRLDLLANQFYGDPTLWWYIARANNLNTMVIPENIQLRIPGTLDYIQGQ